MDLNCMHACARAAGRKVEFPVCPIAGNLVRLDRAKCQEMWLRFSSIFQIFTYMKWSFSSSTDFTV